MTETTIDAQFSFKYSARDESRPDTFSLDIDVSLPMSGVTAIYGHSGSGKTTLLRCIAGLQSFNKKAYPEGFIARLQVGGEVWQDQENLLAPHKRSIGYVFQEAGLFPHLTAEQNIQYGIRRISDKPSAEFYSHILSLMGIQTLLSRLPDQLSGGERQRVAIARALLIKPKLLLMDEPLASLDSARKEEILPFLESLKEESKVPILYVSHSMEEVSRLADNLVMMECGKVVAEGRLNEVLSRIDVPLPASEAGMVVEAAVVEKSSRWHLLRAEFSGGEFWLRDSGEGLGQSIRLRILARDVSLAKESHDDSSILNRLPVEVLEVGQDTDPAMCLVRLAAGHTRLLSRITRCSAEHLQIKAGQRLWAQIKSVAIVR